MFEEAKPVGARKRKEMQDRISSSNCWNLWLLTDRSFLPEGCDQRLEGRVDTSDRVPVRHFWGRSRLPVAQLVTVLQQCSESCLSALDADVRHTHIAEKVRPGWVDIGVVEASRTLRLGAGKMRSGQDAGLRCDQRG